MRDDDARDHAIRELLDQIGGVSLIEPEDDPTVDYLAMKGWRYDPPVLIDSTKTHLVDVRCPFCRRSFGRFRVTVGACCIPICEGCAREGRT